MIGGFVYGLIYSLIRIGLFFWHPVFHVIGRENVPKHKRLVICPNHSGMADPFWVIFALHLGHIPRIMAKKQVMEVPVLGPLLKKLGVIGVDREIADVHAIKEGLRALKEDQQLMIFPEGTRVKQRTDTTPKRGAVTLAARTETEILPVFVTRRRYPWQPVTAVIGESYTVSFAGKRATDEELTCAAEDLMDRIYALEELV